MRVGTLLPFWLLNLIFSILLTTVSARAEIIVNGGFEDPITPNGSGIAFTPGQSIGAPGGWIVVGTPGIPIGVINTNATESQNVDGVPSSILFNSHSGLNSLDPTGAYNQGPNMGVQQTIATTAGMQYLLSFWVGSATPSSGIAGRSYYHDAGTIDLSINGGSRTSFTNTDRTNGSMNWKQFSQEFTATGASTTIAFFNGTSPIDGNILNINPGNNGSNYVGLDDVSIQPASAPEPVGVTLVSICGLVGWAVRRRIKAAS